MRIRKFPPKLAGWRNRQRGIALVIALWVVVLISIIGVAHSRNVRLESQLARHFLERAEAEQLAESGLNRAVLELFVSLESQRWYYNGSVYEVIYDNGRTHISIQNAAGLVDLNSASSTVLSALFDTVGVEQETRDALVDAILDWRDQDDLIRINGAEDDQYRRAGLDYGTPDGKFGSLEELRYVLGMTHEIFEQVYPYITIYSGTGSVNRNFAPERLLNTLTGTTESDGALLSDLEESGLDLGVLDPRAETGGPGAVGRASNAFHIMVKAYGNRGGTSVISAVVDISRNSSKSYRIISWRELIESQGSSDA